MARPNAALYIGGMGARDKNFYNTIAKRYGYVDEATQIQDLYLSGRKDEAAAAVPRTLLVDDPPRAGVAFVAERIAAWRVRRTTLIPAGADRKRSRSLLSDR